MPECNMSPCAYLHVNLHHSQNISVNFICFSEKVDNKPSSVTSLANPSKRKANSHPLSQLLCGSGNHGNRWVALNGTAIYINNYSACFKHIGLASWYINKQNDFKLIKEGEKRRISKCWLMLRTEQMFKASTLCPLMPSYMCMKITSPSHFSRSDALDLMTNCATIEDCSIKPYKNVIFAQLAPPSKVAFA